MIGPWPWDDVGDPVGVVGTNSEPEGGEASCGLTAFLDASMGDERDEKSQGRT